MSYIRPFYPHELDNHPEGRRILAHIDAERDEVEAQASFELDKALDEAEEDRRRELREVENDLTGQLEEARTEVVELRGLAGSYEGLLWDLKRAVIDADHKLLAATLVGVGKALIEADYGISAVELAELEGAADALLA